MKTAFALIFLFLTRTSFADMGIVACHGESDGKIIQSWRFPSNCGDRLCAPQPTFLEATDSEGVKKGYIIGNWAEAGTLKISISSRDKTVDMGSWRAAEMIAQGEIVLRPGVELKVATGSTPMTLVPRLTIICNAE